MTDAPQDGASPFDQLGGAAGVDEMVGQFYQRIFADPMLRPFFESTDQVKLVRMQREFFGAALGGPVAYSGSSLQEAHAGRGIEPRHLARFTEHLVATLRDRGLSADAADRVVARIAMHSDDIVTGGGAGEDG